MVDGLLEARRALLDSRIDRAAAVEIAISRLEEAILRLAGERGGLDRALRELGATRLTVELPSEHAVSFEFRRRAEP